ncbi:MAG TPA: ATP-binding protein [Anaerolineales bacterium]|nr:ATP-binding protein [Anaerolineales bacterium]
MLRSLRNRLIFSHTLPLLIIIPLLGMVLVYVVETKYFIPNLTKNLKGDAKLIADISSLSPGIWNDPRLAQDLLERVSTGHAERIILLTPTGYLLASSDPGDTNRLNRPIIVSNLPELREGQIIAQHHYSQSPIGEIIEVIAPVMDSDKQMIGVVQLTYRYATFYEEFIQLRYLMGGILLFGLIVGVSLGIILALNIERPIQLVTQAVQDLASGKRSELLPEKGPEEIRQLQRAANHLVERLHSLEESRHKLLANLVHELGRPLGALRAAIQALMRGAKSDPNLLDELLEGIDGETIRLQHLTEDLAELHDKMLGPLELDFQSIALAEWLQKQLGPWKESALQQQLHWKEEIPSQLPVIEVDPDRLSQAFGNLVSNAIKYTPAGGTITIAAGVNDSEVWLRVEDTGPGIPAGELEKIFQPFYRGSHGRRFPQGMGLGLSIAHDLVSAHGGRIELESTPGLGSKFTIRLPKRL